MLYKSIASVKQAAWSTFKKWTDSISPFNLTTLQISLVIRYPPTVSHHLQTFPTSQQFPTVGVFRCQTVCLSSSDSSLEGAVQEFRVAGERAEVLLHWSICASHVVHQDHCVRHLVQVHAHCRLDVETNAYLAAVTCLGYFEVPTQVGRDEVRSVWYSVMQIRKDDMLRSNKTYDSRCMRI